MTARNASSRATAGFPAWTTQLVVGGHPLIADEPVEAGGAWRAGARPHRDRTPGRASGPLDDEQRQRLLQVANACPVHRILAGAVEIPTTLS